MTTITLPFDLGSEVYHLQKVKYKVKYGDTYNNTIVHCVVDAIHIGRRLKNIGDTYIILRSINTGYVSCKISLDEFRECCYDTYEAAKQAQKIKEVQHENT